MDEQREVEAQPQDDTAVPARWRRAMIEWQQALVEEGKKQTRALDSIRHAVWFFVWLTVIALILSFCNAFPNLT